MISAVLFYCILQEFNTRFKIKWKKSIVIQHITNMYITFFTHNIKSCPTVYYF